MSVSASDDGALNPYCVALEMTRERAGVTIFWATDALDAAEAQRAATRTMRRVGRTLGAQVRISDVCIIATSLGLDAVTGHPSPGTTLWSASVQGGRLEGDPQSVELERQIIAQVLGTQLESVAPMDNARFWKLVSLADGKACRIDEVVAQITAEDAAPFAERLALTVIGLENDHVYTAACKSLGQLSIDAFVDLCCALVLQGQETVARALAWPESISWREVDPAAEMLLYAADHAHKRRTGVALEYTPSADVYAGGWPDIAPAWVHGGTLSAFRMSETAVELILRGWNLAYGATIVQMRHRAEVLDREHAALTGRPFLGILREFDGTLRSTRVRYLDAAIGLRGTLPRLLN